MASSGAPSALLGAANIEKYKGLAHSVGPFGLRVGFAYQQERALNIVASLKLEGHLKDNPKIAIVGGGLAGMTAYIALHGLGLAATQLFEMSDGVVRVQHAASHRPIHPCYNNWPIAEFFNPTTSLPFFNWSTGSAQYVADSLQYRWKKHYCDSFREINHLHRVTKINLVEGSNGLPSGLMLSSEKQDPSTRLWASIEDQKFDRVIFASGFGEESHLNISRCESYWTPDSIDALREDGGAENIFISGTGDGGLMDCVRFCFREANDRNLFIEFISYLRHPKYGSALEDLNDTKFEQSIYEQAIKKIEDRALELLPDSPDPTMDPFGSSWENKISDYLQTEYLKIIDDLPKGPLKFLEELLFPGWKKIRLIGRTTTPFSCATAPINKLVIAYLIRNNPDLYIQGYMDIDASPLLLLRPDYSKQNLDDEILVIRHGANPPVYEFQMSSKKETDRFTRHWRIYKHLIVLM